MSEARFELAAAVVGTHIYVTEGYEFDVLAGQILHKSSGEVYDCESNHWSAIASMSVDRFEHAMAAVASRMFVFGGFVDGEGTVSSAEVYGTVSDEWTAIAPMGTARNIHVAVAVGTRIFVCDLCDRRYRRRLHEHCRSLCHRKRLVGSHYFHEYGPPVFCRSGGSCVRVAESLP